MIIYQAIPRLLFAGFAWTIKWTTAQACYYPNGNISTTDASCGTNPDYNMCCPLNWECLTNDLCYYQGMYGRYTCTDQSWEAPQCPQLCTDEGTASGDEALLWCPDTGLWCCDGDRSFNCCNDSISSISQFSLEAPTILATITTISSQASASQPSTPSTLGTDGASFLTSSPSPSSTSSTTSSQASPNLLTRSALHSTITSLFTLTSSNTITNPNGAVSISVQTEITTITATPTNINTHLSNSTHSPAPTILLPAIIIPTSAAILATAILLILLHRRHRRRLPPTKPTTPPTPPPELDSFPIATPDLTKQAPHGELPGSPVSPPTASTSVSVSVSPRTAPGELEGSVSSASPHTPVSPFAPPPHNTSSNGVVRALNADGPPAELWGGFVPWRMSEERSSREVGR